jgi:hypothetical protein
MGMLAPQGFNYTIINGLGTTNIQSNPPAQTVWLGLLGGWFVGNPGSAWRIQVYDGPAAAGDPVVDMNPVTTGMTSSVPCMLTAGLTVVSSGTTAGSCVIFWL